MSARAPRRLGLNMPRRIKRTLPKRPLVPLSVESKVNHQWALDFMHDTLYCGNIPSLGAGIGFALLGAWPILPFAGLELIALGAALYYVNWNLEYRQVVTVSERNVKIEKGYFIPKRSWLWEREDTAVNVINAKNQWEGPSLWLHNRESRTSLGEFLNKEEAPVTKMASRLIRSHRQ